MDRVWGALNTDLIILADRHLMAARAEAVSFTGELREWSPGLMPLPGHLDILHVPLSVPSLSLIHI